MRFELASAGVVHAAVLAALHGRCFEETWSTQAIGEVLGSPGAFAYLAVSAGEGGGGRPLGFALARRTGDDAELLTLCVLPEERRRGVGAALLDEVMARARDSGARRLFLEVAETNGVAQALYAERGFVAGRRRPDYYRGPNRVPAAALELSCELRR
jgi:ribosomal-protein-alanine N-acetyltransferase